MVPWKICNKDSNSVGYEVAGLKGLFKQEGNSDSDFTCLTC